MRGGGCPPTPPLTAPQPIKKKGTQCHVVQYVIIPLTLTRARTSDLLSGPTERTASSAMTAKPKSTEQATDPSQPDKPIRVNYQSLTWKDLTFWKSKDWKQIQEKLRSYHGEREQYLLPAKPYIFRPLLTMKPKDVRVVIIGKEPDVYRKQPELDGFAYSSCFWSPAFRDEASATQCALFDEVEAEEPGFVYPSGGSLLRWQKQGVFLWNWRLTSHHGLPAAHSEWGWDRLSIQVLQLLYLVNPKIVFVPWGVPRGFEPLPDNAVTINTAGPMTSYQNAGFFGSSPFKRINNLIRENKLGPEINWNTRL